MSKDLKPCPFCGAPVQMFYEGSSDWTIECSAPKNVCGCNVTFWVRLRAGDDEKTEAVRRWNCRAAVNPEIEK
jgi:hypothetical protein